MSISNAKGLMYIITWSYS